MHIYAFGSVCRGEIDEYSDVDLLAVVTQANQDISVDKNYYSVYSEQRLRELWLEGNPFAWHLYLESKLLFSDSKIDIIKSLGKPSSYSNAKNDCIKFFNIFNEATFELGQESKSKVFELSMIFLAIRNFASCYSLGVLKKANFSRLSAVSISVDSLNITKECFSILERARILATRGKGAQISDWELKIVISELGAIKHWFDTIIKKL